MNSTTNDVTDTVFERQDRVLADPFVSDGAKLVFCKLLCFVGFRGGWILSNSRWSSGDYRYLRELERAGYIMLSCGDVLGARLTQTQGKESV
jgi:hypothetical protein